jgi:hypothetical protein
VLAVNELSFMIYPIDLGIKISSMTQLWIAKQNTYANLQGDQADHPCQVFQGVLGVPDLLASQNIL